MSDFQAEGYFVIVPEWVLDADVSDKAIRLYGVLRSYADHRTGVAFPSRRTLANRLHVADPKAVDRALGELELIGAVDVWRSTPAAPGQGRASNRYLLRHTPPKPEVWSYDHTPRGTEGSAHETLELETPSSDPRGAEATRGKKGTPLGAKKGDPSGPGATTPSGPGAPRGSGAGAPLTRPIEQDPSTKNPPASGGDDARQLALVTGSTPQEVSVNERAQALAAEHYEGTGRVVPFLGIRSIVKAALTAGHGDEQVRAALAHLRRTNRTLTKNALGLLLAGNGAAPVGGRAYGPGYRDPDRANPANAGAFEGPL